MTGDVLAIGLGAACLALWFAAYGVALLLTRPRLADPAPATQELGNEPPAVVSMLVSRWAVTEDAAESTLIDLAARHYLEFRQPGNDPMQTTVHVRDPRPANLTGYEQQVFDRVAGLAVNGVVPLTALTFRDPNQATRFEKRVRAAVIADARAHGLSQRRFSPGLIAGLSGAAALAACGVAAAGLLLSRGTDGHSNRGALIYPALVAFGVLHAVLVRPLGDRDTPVGRQVAGRWLGVRAWLHNTEAFAEQPPASVTVWDRYLSYGAALGTTRVASAVIDLGMGNRKRVWSSYGGTWHRVRVRYPRGWPRYGRPAPGQITKGVLATAAGFLMLVYWTRAIAAAVDQPGIKGTAAARSQHPVTSIGLVIGGVLLVYGLYFLTRMIIDMATPVTLTGQVLWREVWRSTKPSNDSPARPWLHYLAIDDGPVDETKAWGLPVEYSDRCTDGDTVTIKARRWTRRVLDLTVVAEGAQRHLDATAAAADSGLLGDQMAAGNPVAAALGIPHQRTGPGTLAQTLLGDQPSSVGALLTADEVGRALGVPVIGPMVTSAGPMQMISFEDPDAQKVLMVQVSGGMFGKMTIKGYRRRQPLPGIGDEAYANDRTAAARRGDHVVMITPMGPCQGVDPRNVYWLLSIAVGRLPAGVS